MPDEPKHTAADIIYKPTQLSARLMDLVSLIEPCERILDIGSDHGHVPAYLLENRIAGHAVATDIHAEPAETTRRYLRRQGVMQLAAVYHTDGLHGIRLQKGDVVILSGLGGLEMIRVLSESLADHAGVFPEGTKFVLQPQRSFEELRAYLSTSGFSIEEERVSIDRDKFYCILRAVWTGRENPPLGLSQLVLGPVLLKKQPSNFMKYLQHQRNVLKKHMRARPELAAVIEDIDHILNGQVREDEEQQ